MRGSTGVAGQCKRQDTLPMASICQKESMIMTYSQQVQNMCPITKGPKHGPAPIPEEGAWVKAYEIKDISGYTHGVGWCAPSRAPASCL